MNIMTKYQNNNIFGRKYNKLTVLQKDCDNQRRKVICQCDCGNIVSVRLDHVKSNRTKSCGCLRKQVLLKHNLSQSRLYQIWEGMIQRSYNKKSSNYKNYGGRGITVCDEWLNDFVTFKDWAINNGYNDKLTLDRITVNGDYKPSNCRWVTMKEQSNNKRNNKYITYKDETKTLSQWSDFTGINAKTIQTRLRLGWSIDKALTTSVKQYARRLNVCEAEREINRLENNGKKN